ncbi:MAG: SGNH/GDSL hydrolase family protein [Lactobacillales bacterium]|nr:SGNH/GDSL hydrolase family protein [Lactobacillales bacterium]
MFKTIGVVGDSIPEGSGDNEGKGWFIRMGEIICARYPGHFRFANMSNGGDIICDALHRLSYEAFSRNIKFLILNVGANDIKRRANSGFEIDLSVGIRQAYWEKMLKLAKKTGAKIMVLDILPIIEEKGNGINPIRYNSDIEAYNALIGALCQEHGVPFLRRYPHWQNDSLQEYYADGLHPNAKGHQRIAEEVYRKINDMGWLG